MKFIAMILAAAAILAYPAFVGSLIVVVTGLSAVGIAGAWVLDKDHQRRALRINSTTIKA